MNKKILGILGVIILAFVIMAYASNMNTNSDTAHGHDEKTFIIGFSTNPPLAYEDNEGQYHGFELELAEEAAKRNGWNVVIKRINWTDKDEQLGSGKIDCFVGAMTTNSREDQYEWVKPYLTVPQVCIVKSDSNINSVSDLRNKIVETEINTTLAAFLDKTSVEMGGSLIVNELTSYDLILDDINNNISDAVVVDELCAKYYINDNPEFKTFNISSEPYSIAFKLGNTDKRDKMQQALNQIYEDGTVEKIAQKYDDYKISEMINNYTTSN